jgi:multidrug resistance protein
MNRTCDKITRLLCSMDESHIRGALRPRHGCIIPYWRTLIDQGAITQEILNYTYAGSGTEDDPFLVAWMLNDPRNPLLFSLPRKLIITFAVALSTLVVSLTSSAYSGSIRQIIAHFGVSTELATGGLSLFVLGFAMGPLFWAPLSETLGRQISFFASMCGMAVFSAGCTGARNIQTLLVLRFLAGAFGSAPLANGGGTISDIFGARQRALAISLYASAALLGPCMGPVIGGFLGMNAGWRWVEGLLAATAGLTWLIISVAVPETYAPVLLRRRAQTLSCVTGKVYRSKIDLEKGQLPLCRSMSRALSRPLVLLLRETIVQMLSTYVAIVYGTLYMLFAAFPIIYEEGRGWNPGVAGLSFLGIMIGMILGILTTIPANIYYQRVQDANGGSASPEARLPAVMLAAVMTPIGMFWFAWTNSPSIHWSVSIIAGAPFGFGVVLIYLGVMNYLIDSYTIYAASVLAANAILRSVFGAVFPLFTPHMYQSLGPNWASSIPAFLAVLYMPAPFLFYKYGPSIRTRSKKSAESQEYMASLHVHAAPAR